MSQFNWNNDKNNNLKWNSSKKSDLSWNENENNNLTWNDKKSDNLNWGNNNGNNLSWNNIKNNNLNWNRSNNSNLDWNNNEDSNLNWNSDDNNNLDFSTRYWKYLIHTYEQFAQGEHHLTKAYEGNNDYLGFTDDYDFCWGPVNEGDPLEGEEYTDRLWGVYTKTAGEIYLLKANEDITEFEREELLTFAPTGSRTPSIVFNKNGHYEMAVEFTPAGEEIPEIWLLSYPYKEDNIRKICNGTEPQLFMGFGKDIYLLYTDVNQYHIHYRLMSEDFATEYTINEISVERKLHLKGVYKINQSHGAAGIKKRHYIVIYEREDDINPLKYILSTTYIMTENISFDIGLTNTNWVEIFFIYTGTETESLSFSIGLSGIEWEKEEEEEEIEKQADTEAIGFDIGLSGIEWVEIFTIEKQTEVETLGFNIALSSILWVEVT